VTNIRLWQALCTVGLIGCLSAGTVSGGEPSIVFDNRPEAGIPEEAKAQERLNAPATAQEKALLAKEYPVKFPTLIAGTIKSVRIRYFNKETWASEKEARDYVAGFLGNKASEVYGWQIWSQGVEVPEIECIVEFTDEYRKKLFRRRRDVAKVGCSSGIRSPAFATPPAGGILSVRSISFTGRIPRAIANLSRERNRSDG
jgi:hypothetical protein